MGPRNWLNRQDRRVVIAAASGCLALAVGLIVLLQRDGASARAGGPGQAGANQVGILQLGARKIGACEIGAGQIDGKHAGIAEIGVDGGGDRHAGLIHLGVLELGPVQLGTVEIGRHLLGGFSFDDHHLTGTQVDLGQRGVPQDRAAEIGAAQIGTVEHHPGQVGILEIGAEQIGAPQFGAGQRGIGKGCPRQDCIIEFDAVQFQPRIKSAGLLQPVAARPAGQEGGVPGQHDLDFMGRQRSLGHSDRSFGLGIFYPQ